MIDSFMFLIPAEGPRGHFEYRRGLLALEFGRPHKLQHAPHRRLVESLRDDLFRRPAPLHVQLQNLVQQFIRRQAVLIRLAGPQLGRWRFGQNRLRNVRFPPVAPPRNAVDHHLRQIRDHR
jgi:hypothetical protein